MLFLTPSSSSSNSGLGTAIFVHSLTRRCVWTNDIEVVDDPVAVVVLNVDDSTTHAVCSVQDADFLGTYVTLKARWIVAKPSPSVSGLCWIVGRRRRARRFADRSPCRVVHVGVGVAVAISVRAAKGRTDRLRRLELPHSVGQASIWMPSALEPL